MLYLTLFLGHVIFLNNCTLFLYSENKRYVQKKTNEKEDLISICNLQIFFGERGCVNMKMMDPADCRMDERADRPSQLCRLPGMVLWAPQDGTRGPWEAAQLLRSLISHDFPNGLLLSSFHSSSCWICLSSYCF